MNFTTGQLVRLLTSDITGGPQIAGMVGVVGRIDHVGDTTLFWVATRTRKRECDDLVITDRAPYYAEELEVVADAN